MITTEELVKFGKYLNSSLESLGVPEDSRRAVVDPLLDRPLPGKLIPPARKRLLNALLALRHITLDTAATMNSVINHFKLPAYNLGPIRVEFDGSQKRRSMPFEFEYFNDLKGLYRRFGLLRAIIRELGRSRDHRLLDDPTLINIPIATLQAAVDHYIAPPFPQVTLNTADKAYEVWVFTQVNNAINQPNWTLNYWRKMPGGAAPIPAGQPFIVRGAHGRIYGGGTNAQNQYGFAVLTPPAGSIWPTLEVHIDVQYQSMAAGVLLEMDISIIQQVNANICRAAGQHRNPNYNEAEGVFECKLFAQDTDTLFRNASVFIGWLAGMAGPTFNFNRLIVGFCSSATYPRVRQFLPNLPPRVRSRAFLELIPPMAVPGLTNRIIFRNYIRRQIPP